MVTSLFGKDSFVQDRRHVLVLVGLFVLSFALYASTMSRGITWLNTGPDGGDFISAARAWGVPHPTGYPTYTMLLRVFGDVVAIGDHAFRANLFSAVMGALAVPFVYVAALRVLRRLPGSEVGDSRSVTAAALVAALAFGTSRLFWSQATVTEVYTLNTLFASSLLVLTLGVVRDVEMGRSSIRNRVLLAVLLGVGLGNHTTLGLVGAPFGVWVTWLVWGKFGWRGVFDWRPIVGLLAGLSVYIYVPIAASAAPIVSWGSPDSFEGFRWMISGTIYRPYAFGLSNDLISGRIATIAELLFTQFTIVGTVIGIAGLTTIWSYSREFVIASVTSVLVVTVYAVAYDTVDSFIYLILVFMMFSLWLAVGMAVLGQGVRRFAGRTVRLSSFQRQLYVGVFAVVVLIVPVWSVASGWDELNLADEDGPAQFAESTIAKAAGGVVFAEEPELFALVYQAQVADPELDVMIVGPFMLGHDWYWDQLVQYYGDRMPTERPALYEDRMAWIVDYNHGIVPIYSTHDDRDHHDIFNLVTDGDLFRFEY
ncbi:protein O-mannosyl-transferase family [Candidatus Lucifugimonas marina]|uniref:DUF2723 domain-containing protein n=1 Tax=Candidatus Lucifugimonas marina TaxID=3038979 RepID=A0AAJ5ZEK2_9CHLR|nr:DUF2723 domain-containing protein [SAR202 cluster bacterium JH702]MDG0869955.1 DUF2723 domain-containing protein [SAR202 cluster bacterium JH639]WFG34678.1 DUF2723 domain-containing protein [SAR202 cluster bacterium JH545]WFG38606.1 DUF2723 domain-containing protein [SAR202 cluster bacterium JH1073]